MRVFADKAAGYGIPGITLDGTDPDAIAAAFAWAAERARAGQGPTLIELVSMRMCGHAHHDDMLYLGKRSAVRRGSIRDRATQAGYVDRAALRLLVGAGSDRHVRGAARARRRHQPTAICERFKREAEQLVEARGARGHRRAVARAD